MTNNTTTPPDAPPDNNNNSIPPLPVKNETDPLNDSNNPTVANVGKRPAMPIKPLPSQKTKKMLTSAASITNPLQPINKSKQSKQSSIVSGFSLNYNRPSISSSIMSPSSSSNTKPKTQTSSKIIAKTQTTTPNAAQSSQTAGSSTSSSSNPSSSSGSSSTTPSQQHNTKIKRIQPLINKALRKLHRYRPRKRSESNPNNSKMIGQPVKLYDDNNNHRPSSTTKANSEHFNRPSVSSSDFSPSSSSSTGGSSSSSLLGLGKYLPRMEGKTVKRVTPNNSTLITTVFNPQKEWSSSSTEVITQIIKKTLIRSHVHRNHLIPANGTLPLENINGTSPDPIISADHKNHTLKDKGKPDNNKNTNSYSYSSST